MCPPRCPDLLLKSLGAGQHFNLFLSPHERSLVLVFLVRATEERLGLGHLHLVLQVLVVGVVQAGTWLLKLRRVPLFECVDQLLLDGVNLLLAVSIVGLVHLELAEVVPIHFFQVFHLPEHDELLFIDDFLSSLLEHILGPELLLPKTRLSLFFLSVEAGLQGVNLLLVLVQRLRDFLDLLALLLDHASSVPDPLFEGLSLLTRLELNEGLLLVDSFSLLLDSLLELLAA